MIRASLIISFYNRLDYLRLIFAALDKQTFRDFEVITADDGSSEDVVRTIEELTCSYEFPILHLWHEDKGFRKNKILNRAVMSSESDYLIFIDGDCIPHPEFIKEHYENSEEKTALTGRRVNLSSRLTSELDEDKIRSGYPEKALLNIMKDSIIGDTKDAEKGIYVRHTILRSTFNKKQRGLLGCKFSVHKKDMLEINGFDERYTSPSVGEDSDIEYRLKLNGVKVKSLNNIAVQYHLYHKLQERPQQNLDLFEQVKKEKKSYTDYGIIQL